MSTIYTIDDDEIEKSCLLDDKDFVIVAVSHDGESLMDASERLQDDKEVVLTAVKEWWGALQYASGRLQDDEEIVLVALSKNSEAWRYASGRLREMVGDGNWVSSLEAIIAKKRMDSNTPQGKEITKRKGGI